MLNRRGIVLLGIGSIFSPRFAWGSAHNGYCEIRDNGGAYLAQKQIVIHGEKYEIHRAEALASAKPQTVLVETKEGYSRAISDARSGQLPPGSIAVFDRSRFPENVIESFHQEINRTTIYYNVPVTLAEARAVHGPIVGLQIGLPDEILEAHLPRLREVAEMYRSMGAIKIEPKEESNAADWLASQVAEHGPNDLVIIVSHVARTSIRIASPAGRPFQYPTGRLPLIDQSGFALEKAKATGPTVWTIGCETWDFSIGELNLQRSELAFTTKISYPESVAVVRKIKPGSTILKKLYNLQNEVWIPQRLPSQRKIVPIDANHPLPDRPRGLAVVAEVTEGKNIMTTNKQAMA